MSNSEKCYQPKYSVGYEYEYGNHKYVIEKIENGMYYERSTLFVGFLCSRCDVFDANHGANTAVGLGIGLAEHPEAGDVNEPA